MIISYSLIIGVIVHISCQVYKVIYYSIKEKKFGLHYLTSAGGMPSAHSAFTSTVALSLGLTRGFDSDYFAIAFALTAVVIVDSLRLRGAVQIHSEILAKLKLSKSDRERLPRSVGHTLSEIMVGLIIAAAVSLAGYFLVWQALPKPGPV